MILPSEKDLVAAALDLAGRTNEEEGQGTNGGVERERFVLIAVVDEVIPDCCQWNNLFWR